MIMNLALSENGDRTKLAPPIRNITNVLFNMYSKKVQLINIVTKIYSNIKKQK